MAKLDRRNRVALPKEILQTLNVKAGDWIRFVNEKGIIYVFPVKRQKVNG